MSQDRFRSAATILLKGGFINRHTDENLFDYLESADNLEQLAEYLRRVGLRPALTVNEQTWYAALDGVNEDNRAAARETAANAKRELRHWVSFLKLAMIALDEPAPCAGATFYAHRLLSAVQDKLNLQETLRTLAQRLRSTPDASIQASLDAVLRWAVRLDQNLLEVLDEQRGIYRLAGKVDWVIDMIQAFDESIERPAGKPPKTA